MSLVDQLKSKIPTGLRTWQADALRLFFNEVGGSTKPVDFLTVAFPGAGKTRFSLTLAKILLDTKIIERLIVMVPSDPLRDSWAENAEQHYQIKLDKEGKLKKNNRTRTVLFDPEYHGHVMTYHGAANVVNDGVIQQYIESKRTLLICDEVHHMSENNSWGQKIFDTFKMCSYRLTLSGTPFRTDKTRIPFIKVDVRDATETEPQQQYLYQAGINVSYEEGIRDGYLRRLAYAATDGEVTWTTKNHEKITKTFKDDLSKFMAARRLRTGLNATAGHTLAPELIKKAVGSLAKQRVKHPKAQGIVICKDIAHASEVQTVMENMGENPTVISSDRASKNNKDELKKFIKNENGRHQWIISVNMISEGVDIPNATHLLFLTTVKTLIYFLQAIGRILRKTIYMDTVAKIFLLDDPEYIAYIGDLMAECAQVPILERASSSDEEKPEYDGSDNVTLLDGMNPNACDEGDVEMATTSVAGESSVRLWDDQYKQEYNPAHVDIAWTLAEQNFRGGDFEACYKYSKETIDIPMEEPVQEVPQEEFESEVDQKKKIIRSIMRKINALAYCICRSNRGRIIGRITNVLKWSVLFNNRDGVTWNTMPPMDHHLTIGELRALLSDENWAVLRGHFVT
jgi:superfamily II DNA or RNA helicase